MQEAAGLGQSGIFEMATGSGPVVLGVLILLIILSVWSWAITIAKCLQFRKAKADSDEFGVIFWETRNLARIDDSSRRLEASPLVRVFHSGYRELSHIMQEAGGGEEREINTDLDSVERALKRAEYEESLKLERGVTFLASVASAAPFIGLFGTVWGIMNAFMGLSTAKSTTIQAVAPGISEALVATAIGLAAAIPAAVAYNYFAVANRNFRGAMNKFSSEFLNLARKYFEGQAQS
jgi:biopolymer transport protein TolQ